MKTKKPILLCVVLALLLAGQCLAAPAVDEAGQVHAVEEAAEAPISAALLETATEVTIEGVTYALSGETAAVAGYTADIAPVCVIPASITVEGTDYPVTALASSALYNCARITSITLPESLTSIGSLALAGCTGLTEVTIPAAVTTVESDALRDCAALTTIRVAENNAGGYTADGVALFNAQKELMQYAVGNPQTSYTIPAGTTAVLDYSFFNAKGLTSVTFPDSLERVASYAFYQCDDLAQVDFGQGIKRLESNSFWYNKIAHVVLPAGMTYIGQGAFSDGSVEDYTIEGDGTGRYYTVDGVLFDRTYSNGEVTGLALLAYPVASPRTSYTVPEDVVMIAGDAFRDAENLTSVLLPDGLEGIGFTAFCNGKLTEITIPDSVTYLDNHVFELCDELRAVTLGSGITALSDGLFARCTALEEITIPAGVTTIGSNVFQNCTGLTAIHVAAENENYQDIDGVLYNKAGDDLLLCPAGAAAVTVPAEVTAIQPGALSACAKVAAIGVAEGNETFFVQDGVLFQRSAGEDGSETVTLHTYPLGKQDVDYTVPDGVTAIADYAFYYNTALRSLNTNQVKTVGGWATGLSHLTELTLPKVEEMARYAVFGCDGLKTVTFPATLTVLNGQCFDYSDGLEQLTFSGGTPPTLPEESGWYGVFYNCPALRYVYVPVGTQVAYKSALAGNVTPGALIVEGTYVPSAEVVKQIEALTETSLTDAINAAAANVARLLLEEQDALTDEALAKVDELFQAAHAGELTVTVDQNAVTDTTLTVRGLAVASALVEGQDETGKVEGNVTLTAVQTAGETQREPLVLDFTMTVNNAPAQPQAPVVITLTLPEALRGQSFRLVHDDGQEEEAVAFTQTGDQVTFRAKFFSRYIFRLTDGKGSVQYTAEAEAKVFVAGYDAATGQMKSIRVFPVAAGTGAVEFDGQEGLSYKAFVLDDALRAVGTATVTAPGAA